MMYLRWERPRHQLTVFHSALVYSAMHRQQASFPCRMCLVGQYTSITMSIPSLPIPRIKKHRLTFIELVGVFLLWFPHTHPLTQTTTQHWPTSFAGTATEVMLGCCMLPEKNPTLKKCRRNLLLTLLQTD